MYFCVFEMTLTQKNYTQKTITINRKNILSFYAKFDFIYSGQENNPKYVEELSTKNVTIKTNQ